MPAPLACRCPGFRYLAALPRARALSANLAYPAPRRICRAASQVIVGRCASKNPPQAVSGQPDPLRGRAGQRQLPPSPPLAARAELDSRRPMRDVVAATDRKPLNPENVCYPRNAFPFASPCRHPGGSGCGGSLGRRPGERIRVAFRGAGPGDQRHLRQSSRQRRATPSPVESGRRIPAEAKLTDACFYCTTRTRRIGRLTNYAGNPPLQRGRSGHARVAGRCRCPTSVSRRRSARTAGSDLWRRQRSDA